MVTGMTARRSVPRPSMVARTRSRLLIGAGTGLDFFGVDHAVVIARDRTPPGRGHPDPIVPPVPVYEPLDQRNVALDFFESPPAARGVLPGRALETGVRLDTHFDESKLPVLLVVLTQLLG